MTCKMNTKIMAALAVFAMMFAGFGAVFVAEANDADNPVVEKNVITINIAGVVDTEDFINILGADWAALYTVTFDDDIEEKITVLTKEYYDAIKDAAKGVDPFTGDNAGKVSIKGELVTFDPAIIDAPVFADVVEGLKLFTSLEMNKMGEIIGGVDTTLKYTKELAGDAKGKVLNFDFVFADDVEIIVAIAVAAVEAEYADYLSPEEVAALIEEIKGELYTKEELDTAVAKAIADTKALYKDYKSPADVQKIVDKAIEEYKATHPGKDDTFLYVTIVLVAVVLALGGFMVFDKVIKPKMAKKDEIQVI